MARKVLDKPSANDWQAFDHLDRKTKAQILYVYLYEGRNMEETAERIFGRVGQDTANTVSTVMRCYGFTQRNSAYFKRKKGYCLEYGDFEQFVRDHPKGCADWPDHNTIDEYMKSIQDQRIRQGQDVRENKEEVFRTMPGNASVERHSKKPGNGSGMSEKAVLPVVVTIIAIAVIWFVLKKFRIFGSFSMIGSYYSSGIAGLLEIASTCTFYASIIILVYSVVKKILRKNLAVILFIHIISYALSAFAVGNISGGIVRFAIALAGYYVGYLFYKKKS